MSTSLRLSFPPFPHSRGRRALQHRTNPSELTFSFLHRKTHNTSLHSSVKPKRSSQVMASDGPHSFPINQSQLTQLNGDSDFDRLLSSDGLISICGFGSLLSERSARSTFPDLINFRVARLNDFRRVFAHVAPIFFERGIAKPETKEISSLSVEPCEGESLIVTVFEIQRSEIPSFIKREHEFRFLAVFPETLDGKPYSIPAVLCARYSDEEFFQIRCKAIVLQGARRSISKNTGDITSIRFGEMISYLVVFIFATAFWQQGIVAMLAYNYFLDHTFIADRKTTIRQYLATTGSGIMEEEPLGSLKFRYGG